MARVRERFGIQRPCRGREPDPRRRTDVPAHCTWPPRSSSGTPPRAAEVEEAIRTGLGDFLHPLRGGPMGTGWDFGDDVWLSQVAQLVEATAGVDFAEQLQLTSGGAVFGESVPVPPSALPSSGRHLLRLRVEA